jgi:hypothetical protein
VQSPQPGGFSGSGKGGELERRGRAFIGMARGRNGRAFTGIEEGERVTAGRKRSPAWSPHGGGR